MHVKRKILTSIMSKIISQKEKGLGGVVEACAACLEAGGVIAVPTDTIYGLACLAQSTAAVERIYNIKGRESGKPVAISVAAVDDIYKWSNVPVPRELLARLLPGPVTAVLARTPALNPALNPGTQLVGIRVPDCELMTSLAARVGPVALTSANLSGNPSCLNVQEFSSLWDRLDLVVDGGQLSLTESSRRGSTVVDLSVPGSYRVVRPGSAYDSTCAVLQEFELRESAS